jgi:hypothetical protein
MRWFVLDGLDCPDLARPDLDLLNLTNSILFLIKSKMDGDELSAIRAKRMQEMKSQQPNPEEESQKMAQQQEMKRGMVREFRFILVGTDIESGGKREIG